MSPSYLPYVRHGAAGNTARGFTEEQEPVVLWLGTADPDNAIDGDLIVRVPVDEEPPPGGDITFVGGTSAKQDAGTTVTITKHESVQEGDRMVAAVGTRGSVTISGAPTDWNLVRSDVDGTFGNLYTYEKIATGSEPSDYTWTASTSTRLAGGIGVWRGVATGELTNAGAIGGTSTTEAIAPTVTTAVDASVLVTVWATSTGTGVTDSAFAPPGGMDAEVFDVTSTNATAVPNVVVAMAYEARATAGATGTRTATMTYERNNPIGVSAVLAPA